MRRILANHVRKYHDKVECVLCGESVIRKDFKKHGRRLHPGEKVTSRDGSSSNSRKRRSDKERYFCHVCKRGFTTAKAMGAHKSARHPQLQTWEKPPPPLSSSPASSTGGGHYPRCEPCGKNFISAAHLDMHRKERHKNEERVDRGEECKICGKVVRDLW